MMEESFLPWWLMLLLGMWAVALALWQSTSIHREVRMWSGVATLVYIGLIFLALGTGSRRTDSQQATTLLHSLATIGTMACMVVSVIASVWMLGRASSASRQISYLIATFANAGFCVLLGDMETAAILLIAALVSASTLWRTTRLWPMPQRIRGPISRIFEFADEPIRSEDAGRFWLTCGVNGIVACAILGTVGYSLRVESARVAQSPRHSALPSREQIVRSAEKDHSSGMPSLLEYAFGARADVIVLLAVIVFLCLANVINESTPSESDSKVLPDSQSQSQELA